MRILKSLITLSLLLGLTTLNSCKKNKKTTAPTGTMTATIDGNAANCSTHTTVVTGSANSANFTTIQGNASDGSSMSLTIYGTLTAGATYTSNDPDPTGEPIL